MSQHRPTSQKHRTFVEESMFNKKVTDLAGIGPVSGRRLAEAGYTHAYVVLGHFLLLKKNAEPFMEWLEQVCGANRKHQCDCYHCLREWCENFL